MMSDKFTKCRDQLLSDLLYPFGFKLIESYVHITFFKLNTPDVLRLDWHHDILEIQSISLDYPNGLHCCINYTDIDFKDKIVKFILRFIDVIGERHDSG